VIRDLFPLVFALVAAAAIYAIREWWRNSRRLRPRFPEITMEEVWQAWRDGASVVPDGPFAPEDWDRTSLSESVLETAHSDLLMLGERLSRSADRRRDLRRGILESVTLALHIEALLEMGEAERAILLEGYQPGTEEQLHDALRLTTILWMLLRQYARLKYDEANREDWFHHYVQTARPYIREKARCAKARFLHKDGSAGQAVTIYDTLLMEMFKTLLDVHAKKRFPPPDLPELRAREATNEAVKGVD
jgi:hypothetical protein